MNYFDTTIQAIINPSTNLDLVLEQGASKEHLEQIKAIRENLILLERIQSEEVSSLNKKLYESRDDTFEIISKLKESLQDALKESRNTQGLAKSMFILTFLLGFILIGISLYFGIKGKDVLAIAFGSFGVIDIVAHLIADPPLKIQDSRSNYAQLTVGILAWFNDLVDKSGMLVVNNQLNAQIQNMQIDINSKLVVQEKILDNYLRLSGTQIDNTVRILSLIDEIAEPSKRKKPTKEKAANKS